MSDDRSTYLGSVGSQKAVVGFQASALQGVMGPHTFISPRSIA
jgi:hypothetical protein